MANENIEKKDMSLDDANRVRVLSPGMMVFKRFIRNKLAIVGIVIIVFMFLFSFVGGLLNPYSQSQVFYTTEQILKDYAGATTIDQYQIYQVDGVKLPSDIYSKTLIAASTKKYVFETRDGSLLGLGNVGEGVYRIFSLEEVNMLLKNLNDLFSATKSKIPRIKLFASAHKCINILARARISVLILFGT